MQAKKQKKLTCFLKKLQFSKIKEKNKHLKLFKIHEWCFISIVVVAVLIKITLFEKTVSTSKVIISLKNLITKFRFRN